MSLKSIKSNYIKFLQVLKDEGMTINESQKEILDGFIGSIEDTILQTRDDAIRTTKKLVEEKMEKEYKTVFESILTHRQEHQQISEKIQSAVNENKEQEPLVEAIDRYLEKYVEQILPKKSIVDYDRLEKLERIHESMKGLLQTKETVKEDTDTETPEKPVKGEEEKKSSEEEKKPTEEENKVTTECTEVKTVAQDIEKILEDGEGEKAEGATTNSDTPSTDTPIETNSSTENEDEGNEGEQNLEEAIQAILEGEKAASTERNTSSKDVDSTEINHEASYQQPIEQDGDTPHSVQITNETMQMWIDAINRTTPQK